MLSGRRAFAGEEVSDTLACVITKDVDWSVLPAGTPRHIHRLLRRCIEKDPKRRLRDIGEGGVSLAGGAPAGGTAGGGGGGGAAARGQAPHARRAPGGGARG